MKIIGLTGGIGSGKSTVSSYFKELGIPVFDADAVSRSAVRKGSACLADIVAFFGPDCLLENGELNRPWVAQRVFSDPKLLQQYERIVQDRVWEEAQRFLAEQQAQNALLTVLDVPLLIECGWHRKVDEVWLVKVSRSVQIERAMRRDRMQKEAVEARVKAQMPLEEKIPYAARIIDNEGTLEDTRHQVREGLAHFGFGII